ncbi:MAG: ABC transporter permease [Actinomycetota bacterium]
MEAVGLGLLLALIGLAVAGHQRLRIRSELVITLVRAAVQLTVVALIIEAAFSRLGYSALFVAVMFTAASWTAAHRMSGINQRLWIAAGSVAAGAGTALLALFGLGGYPLTPRYLIPIAGILIGGTMTAAGLAGRRITDELSSKVSEIEARLSLGVTARYALRSYVPGSIRTALIPVLDQTKNVGLVTLPGAFVGMILGGASPVQAAQVQLTVLFSLLGAQTIAATVSATGVARSFVGPGEGLASPQSTAS